MTDEPSYTSLRQLLRIWTGCDFAKSPLLVTLPYLGMVLLVRINLALSRQV